MDNLTIYNHCKEVPENAQKSIQAGRLKGMTDINPMWRINKLTEIFGPCGIGWYYEVTNQWLEDGSDNQKIAFVNINLYIKVKDEWSKPIFGTGGSSFIAKERNGFYTSDECYKMALTDSISVACKSLGIGADIYWKGGRSKYDTTLSNPTPNNNTPNTSNPNNLLSDKQIKRLYTLARLAGFNTEQVKEHMKSKFNIESTKNLSRVQYDQMCTGYESAKK